MFFGSYTHTIDSKGRTALPAKLREALAVDGDPKIMLVRNQESRSLICLPPSLAARLRARMAAISPFDRRAVANMLQWSSAQDVEFDGSGRVLVPPALRSYAGLTKEVVWAGMGSHILLFDKATYEAELEKVVPPEQRWDPLASE